MRTGRLRAADGDPPFTPRGCIAQVWSVAETLGAWLAVGAADPVGDAPVTRRGSRPA